MKIDRPEVAAVGDRRAIEIAAHQQSAQLDLIPVARRSKRHLVDTPLPPPAGGAEGPTTRS